MSERIPCRGTAVSAKTPSARALVFGVGVSAGLDIGYTGRLRAPVQAESQGGGEMGSGAQKLAYYMDTNIVGSLAQNKTKTDTTVIKDLNERQNAKANEKKQDVFVTSG